MDSNQIFNTTIERKSVIDSIVNAMQTQSRLAVVGPTGSGKTFVAKALAIELDALFFNCIDATLESDFYQVIATAVKTTGVPGESAASFRARLIRLLNNRSLVFDHIEHVGALVEELSTILPTNQTIVTFSRLGGGLTLPRLDSESIREIVFGACSDAKKRFKVVEWARDINDLRLLNFVCKNDFSTELTSDPSHFIESAWNALPSEDAQVLVKIAGLPNLFSIVVARKFVPHDHFDQVFTRLLERRWIETDVTPNAYRLPSFARKIISEKSAVERPVSLYDETAKHVRGIATSTKSLRRSGELKDYDAILQEMARSDVNELQALGCTGLFLIAKFRGHLASLIDQFDRVRVDDLTDHTKQIFVLAFAELLILADEKNRAAEILAQWNLYFSNSEFVSLAVRSKTLMSNAIDEKSTDLALEKITQALKLAGDSEDALLEAHCRERAGFLLLAVGNISRAQHEFEICSRTFQHENSPDAFASAAFGLAYATFRSNDLAEAQLKFAEGLDTLGRSGESIGFANASFNLGTVLHHQGKLDDACRYYDIALTVWQKHEYVDGLAAIHERLATLEIERKDYISAREFAYDALAFAKRSRQQFRATNALGWIGTTFLLAGDPERARSFFDDMSNNLPAVDVEQYLALRLIEVIGFGNTSRTLIQQIEAVVDTASDDEKRLRLFLDDIRVCGTSGQCGDPLIESAELRVTRMVNRLGSDGSTDDDAFVLIVDPRCEWFYVGGELVDLSTRKPLRKLLQFLVDVHETAPFKPSPVESLIEAGWPDEKLTKKSGSNRVYTAIRFLRDMGLERFLVTKGGYRFADQVVIDRRSERPV